MTAFFTRVLQRRLYVDGLGDDSPMTSRLGRMSCGELVSHDGGEESMDSKVTERVGLHSHRRGVDASEFHCG